MIIQEFLKGIRFKTLSAAIVPPLLAAAFLYFENGQSNLYILVHCLGLAIFLQMATNFYNDGIDFKKGADKDRVGPARISNEQNLKRVFLFGHFCLLLALLAGIPLVLEGGPIFAFIGLVSMFLAYGYTGGPFPLAYLGLGELFVYLFFGLVATMGSAYLIGGYVNLHLFLVASIAGLHSTVLIMINNHRDAKKDILVGKKTLATRVSKTSYLKILDFCLFGPYLIILYFFIFIDLKFVFPILAAGLAHRIRYTVHESQELVELNGTLALAGKHLVVFSSLFILSCLV